MPLYGQRLVTITVMLWPDAPPVPWPEGAEPVEVSLKHVPQPEPHHVAVPNNEVEPAAV